VVGVDVELGALRAIQQRPELGLVQAMADALPFRAASFDVVGLLAVLEHVADDRRALQETHRVARPGAIQLLLTSAFEILWSHHDVANNHCRRYRAQQLSERLRAAGWRVLVASYVNVLFFPAVLAVRLAQRWLKPAGWARYDTGPTFGPIGWLLEAILAVESVMIIHLGIRFPFGVNLFGISGRDG
jgi:SAM-dependent methyltransferase